MNFERWVSLGISHHNAPIAMRERLAVTPAAWRERAPGLRELIGPDGGLLVLSTCNRVEWIADVENSARLPAVVHHLTSVRNPLLWKREGWDVLRHLARVAAGLDSMLVGETEIASQVKKAYAQSIEWGLVSAGLHALVQQSLRIAKHARFETKLDQGRVSLFSIAASLIRELTATNSLRAVLLLGSGEAAERMVKELMRVGAKRILRCRRDNLNPHLLAQRASLESSDLRLSQEERVIWHDSWSTCLSEVEAFVACSGSGLLPWSDPLRDVLDTRQTPLVVVDLGVPRNIPHEMERHKNVFIYNVDDLAGRALRHYEMRRAAAEHAETIVSKEISRLSGKVKS